MEVNNTPPPDNAELKNAARKAGLTGAELEDLAKKIQAGQRPTELVPDRISKRVSEEFAELERMKKELTNPLISPKRELEISRRYHSISESLMPVKLPKGPGHPGRVRIDKRLYAKRREKANKIALGNMIRARLPAKKARRVTRKKGRPSRPPVNPLPKPAILGF